MGALPTMIEAGPRRPQLTAEGSGVPALILRRWWTVAEKDLTRLPTAASTRWLIVPAPYETLPAPRLKRPCWQVDLFPCLLRRTPYLASEGL
jgi:protein ImuA